MLSPKRVKFRKQFKGRMTGLSQRGNTVAFGTFGLQALEPGWVTSRQIEAARVALTRHIKRGGKVWIRIFPDKPITKKPAETRMVEGVTKGFSKNLELVGVGYKAEKRPYGLQLSLGYSHPIEYRAPQGITLNAPVPTQIVVEGANKEVVGQVAAEIRSLRPPEPYKGKGVKYAGEQIRRKAGKAGGK